MHLLREIFPAFCMEGVNGRHSKVIQRGQLPAQNLNILGGQCVRYGDLT